MIRIRPLVLCACLTLPSCVTTRTALDPEVVVPPARPASPPAAVPAAMLAAAAARITPANLLSAAAAPPAALGRTAYSDRQLEVEVSGHRGAVHTRDRSLVIWVPWGEQATVHLVRSTVGPVSSALDVRGHNTADLAGRNVTLPLRMNPCSVLVLYSGSAGGNPQPVYGFGPPTSSVVDEGWKVCTVPYAPRADYYSPVAAGDPIANPITLWLRSTPIPEQLLDMGRLPSVIDVASLYQPRGPIPPAGWNQSPPSIAESLAIHRRWSGDLFGEWRVADRVPYTQHQGYGTNVMDAASDAIALLCSTAPVAEKVPLAHAIVQRGLEELGRAVDGMDLYPSGGHCRGREPFVVVMGHLLGVDVFADPDSIREIGPHFAENDLQRRVPWWFCAADANPSHTVPWPFARAAGSDGSLLAQPPSAWGSASDPTHGSYAWQVDGYYRPTVGASLGAGLGILLMGAERHCPEFVAMCRQHMLGVPPAAQAQLDAAHVKMLFGTDHGAHERFAPEAWRKYGGLESQ